MRFAHAFSVGVISISLLVGCGDGKQHNPQPGPLPYQTASPVVQQKYSKPATAPNGEQWPAAAGYVKGYKELHSDGLSSVTIDNRQNDSDVFVKLVSLDGKAAYPVRQFYVAAHGGFTVNNVRAGTYDIRYRDLDSGGLSRSEKFDLEEIEDHEGTRFSNFTMTLYKVANGNMQTYGLSEAEF